MSTSCSVPFFFPDVSRQGAATTTAHIIRLIGLLKEQKLLTSTLSTTWGNIDGCSGQYICSLALYLMSIIYQY